MDGSEASGNDLDAVESEIQYILPTSRINRRYVSPQGQINLSEYRSEKVLVRDARPMGDQASLERVGFTLRKHSSAVSSFEDPEQVNRIYLSEMMALVRDVTGANRVIPFAWMMRSSTPSNDSDAQPPANDVHVDHTPDFSECMARRALTWMGEPDASYRRFILINTWRAYKGAPQDWPLGLCDPASVADDEGVRYPILMVDRLPKEEEIPEVLPGDPSKPEFPEISAFEYRPEHRWYFFSNLSPDEVLLFKNYDSDRTGAWRVPHAGFSDPRCTPDGPRRSIEVRFLAFFE